jgi:hypothetical protein
VAAGTTFRTTSSGSATSALATALSTTCSFPKAAAVSWERLVHPTCRSKAV